MSRLNNFQSSGLTLYSPKELRQKVRFAQAPDNPVLISMWLQQDGCCNHFSERGACSRCSAYQRREAYRQQLCLLLETVFDELLPAHWRIACLNQIYKPMQQMRKLARSASDHQQLRSLAWELAIGSQYVSAGLGSFHSGGITNDRYTN